MNSARSSNFNVYGFCFSVHSQVEDPLRGIEEDFAFFVSSEPAGGVRIDLLREAPPLQEAPLGDAVAYTPRNVVYRSGGKRYIDYHGKAFGIQDESNGDFRLYSCNSDLLYEAAYLYLLSRIGQFLDAKGIHRLHALGVVIRKKAVLVMLPMGGGKSTLGLHILCHPQVQILSDDSPFIDRKGALLAYPLRLGLLPGSEDAVPADQRRTIQRMEFGTKHLVSYRYFAERVCASAEPGLLVVGVRTMAPDCRIERIGAITAWRTCVANCVVGIGLFQGLEFLLQASVWELWKKGLLGLSRARNCWRLIRRSQTIRIHLGRDPQLNAKTLLEYAERAFESGR